MRPLSGRRVDPFGDTPTLLTYGFRESALTQRRQEVITITTAAWMSGTAVMREAIDLIPAVTETQSRTPVGGNYRAR
jgi:hypothetical protein